MSKKTDEGDLRPHRTKVTFIGQGGFSMIELVVAMAIGTVVGVMVLMIASDGLRNLRHIRRLERLHTNAVLTFDIATYWIKQAQNLNVNGSCLELTLPDSTKKTIFLDAAAVKLGTSCTPDANTGILTTSDVSVPVNGLTFTRMTDSVRVSLDLQAVGGLESLSLATTIARRNQPL